VETSGFEVSKLGVINYANTSAVVAFLFFNTTTSFPIPNTPEFRRYVSFGFLQVDTDYTVTDFSKAVTRTKLPTRLCEEKDFEEAVVPKFNSYTAIGASFFCPDSASLINFQNAYSNVIKRHMAFNVEICTDENKHPDVDKCAPVDEIKAFVNTL
jgi:hypothetical protein